MKHGMMRAMVVFAVALCAAAHAAEVKRIPLEVFSSRAEVPKYPIEIGVPFERGVLSDATKIRLLGADGSEIPCQVEPLSRHVDGSLRAVLLVFFSSIAKDRSMTYTVEFGDGISRRAVPPKPVAVSGKDGVVVVDTGSLRFESGKGGVLFGGVSAGGGPVLSEGVVPFIQEAGQGGAVLGEQMDVTVEERGPVRAVILVKGRFGTAADAHGYRARIHAYAGSGILRVQHTVVGVDGEKAFELAGWGLRLRTSATNAVCGVDGTPKELALAKGEGLFQDGVFEYAWGPLSAEERQAREKKRIPYKPGEVPGWRFRMVCTQGGGEPREAKADGWLAASVPNGNVGICVRDFWQQFPKEWAGSDEDITIWLHSPKGAPFLGKPGTAKTHEMLFSFSPEGSVAASTRALNDVFQDWPLARVSPEWVCATGVFGGLLPRSDPFTEHYNNIVDVMLAFIVQSGGVIVHDASWYMYGNADFGDISKPLFNWNVPRGQNAAYIVEFLRGGDREWARLGARAARHYADIDVCHARTKECDLGRAWSGAGGWNTNREPMKKRTPRVLSVGKNETAEEKVAQAEKDFRSVLVPRDVHQQYLLPRGEGAESHTGGALPYYFLSGDRRALEVLREQGEWFLKDAEARKARDADLFSLPGLLDAYEGTGDKRFLAGAVGLIKGFIAEWKVPLEQRRGLAELKAKADAGKIDKNKVPTHGYWEIPYLGGGRDMEPFVRRPRSVFRFLNIGAPESETGVNTEEVRRMLAECVEISVFWQEGGCTPSYIHPWTMAANLGLWPEQTRELFEKKVLVFITISKNGWGEVMKDPAKVPLLKYKLPFLPYNILGPSGWRTGAQFVPLDVEAARRRFATETFPVMLNLRFLCSLHELGIEHTMLSYPHFLAAWKPYHGKHLKPRMNADGVFEFRVGSAAAGQSQ